jgi:hypothetical protein
MVTLSLSGNETTTAGPIFNTWDSDMYTGPTSSTRFYTTSTTTAGLYEGDTGTTASGNTLYVSDSGTISVSSSTNLTIDGSYPYLNTGTTFVWDSIPNKKALLKEKIRQNLLIRTVSRSLNRAVSPEEQRARDSLRDLISEQDWRRYVTNGFIMVKGYDCWYQIFNEGNIKVYRKGKHTHSICIHTDQSCPPTDHVLNMKLLVEIDEAQIWRGGNITNHNSNGIFVTGGGGLTINNGYGNTLLEIAQRFAVAMKDYSPALNGKEALLA